MEKLYIEKKQIKKGTINLLSTQRETNKHKSLILLANGPSLSEVNLKPLLKYRDKLTFAWINCPCSQIKEPEQWYMADGVTVKRWRKYYNRYNGIVISIESAGVPVNERTVIFQTNAPLRFSTDYRQGLSLGSSTLFLSMQIAYYQLFKRVYIFGCDLSYKKVGRKRIAYFQNSLEPHVGYNEREKHFAKEVLAFESMNDLPQSIRHKYVWCSSWNPHNFVDDLFIRYKHETAVSKVIKDLGK